MLSFINIKNMEYQLIDVTQLKKFLLGGKAEFTIKNINSGNHLTFKVKNKKDDIYYLYIKLKTYIYIGYISANINMSNILITYSTNIEDEEREYYNVLKSFLEFVFKNQKIPKGIEVYYTGKCSVCNRLLTDPESIKIGIGEKCLENYGK